SENRVIDSKELEGLERIHFALVDNGSNGEPVLELQGVQDVRKVTVKTIFSVFGEIGDITLEFPLPKEVIVWDDLGIGYRFKNMEEAFEASKNGFKGIDRTKPANTVNAEEGWLEDFDKVSSSLGNIGVA